MRSILDIIYIFKMVNKIEGVLLWISIGMWLIGMENSKKNESVYFFQNGMHIYKRISLQTSVPHIIHTYIQYSIYIIIIIISIG